MVRVLHVVPGLLPGGMELTMSRVVSALEGADMRHTVVCLKEQPVIARRFPSSVDIHCMHARPNELRLPLRLAELIRRTAPTVIHARNWGAWPDAALGRLFSLRRVPLIFSFHGLGTAQRMPLRRRLAFRLLPRITTHLFTVSRDSRRMLVEEYGWPAEGVEVIPNGVDTVVFSPAPRQRKSESLVLGTVGNLRPVKNHALLLRCTAALLAGGLDLDVRIAGTGSERDNLLRLAESLGISERLQLAGHVEEVASFLRDLDVFVLSSDSEQHPNALMEAMACGLPCVATAVGNVTEVLEDGRCGLIIGPGDLDALVAAARQLAGDAALRARLGVAARERVCRQYDARAMIAAYDRMYRRFSTA